MNWKMVRTITLGIFTLVFLALGTAQQALAAETRTPFPNMPRLEQYRMERNAEIALARSAARASISGDATVMVLGAQGYETAVEGKNGFICHRGRSRSSAQLTSLFLILNRS